MWAVSLYCSKLWRITEKLRRILDTFRRKCLRRILKIHWADKISNQQLYEQTLTILTLRTIQGMHWRWIGHVLRRDNSANIRTALTGAPDGNRGEEGQRTPASTQWRKREKNWNGIIKKRHRLLSATVVKGIFCCATSCVLRGHGHDK